MTSRLKRDESIIRPGNRLVPSDGELQLRPWTLARVQRRTTSHVNHHRTMMGLQSIQTYPIPSSTETRLIAHVQGVGVGSEEQQLTSALIIPPSFDGNN